MLSSIVDHLRQTSDVSIEYHLRELEIAKNRDDPRNVLPDLLESERTILDIGCGIGQTLIALDCADRQLIGVDVDEEAIAYGRQHHAHIEFFVAAAQDLPVGDDSVDLVISRVALPYTNVPKVFDEIKRVLRPGGRAWMTFHSRAMAGQYWRSALSKRDVRDLVHKTYVLLNGYSLKYVGRLIPFINRRYESWQDLKAISRLLRRRDFDVSTDSSRGITYVEARLRA